MAGSQSQAMLEKMELRQSYRNVWHTDLTNAVAADLPCAYPGSSPSLFLRHHHVGLLPVVSCDRRTDARFYCRVLPVSVVVSGRARSLISQS